MPSRASSHPAAQSSILSGSKKLQTITSELRCLTPEINFTNLCRKLHRSSGLHSCRDNARTMIPCSALPWYTCCAYCIVESCSHMTFQAVQKPCSFRSESDVLLPTFPQQILERGGRRHHRTSKVFGHTYPDKMPLLCPVENLYCRATILGMPSTQTSMRQSSSRQ